MSNPQTALMNLLETNQNKVFANLSRPKLIQSVLDDKNALLSPQGNLYTWTPAESTGRSPKDTYIVCHSESEKNIDWSSANNIPMESTLFDELFNDALKTIETKDKIYVTDRVIGADNKYALPVKLITNNALSALFSDNMFRDVPQNIEQSILHDKSFMLLALPYDKIQTEKYQNQLRQINGKTSDMVIVMDLDRKIGLVYGCAYCGAIKKTMFTVMNYYTPEKGILPLHSSANIDDKGNTAVILGLSGTGKTTLSADERRPLIGDDEHGWSDNGIANFENGCYAKLINLNPKKEPEIFRISFGENKDYLKSGVIIENTMIYPNGEFDLDDDRLTANSRVSYPMTALKNFKEDAKGNHPQTILFLTADANGVLPPVSKLNANQAMLWFVMGYTSKLAGTETGITEPVSAFSRFFGAPFMPRNPEDYASLLNKKIIQHNTNVYLINTGWTGGAYGTGKRIDINVTRAIVDATLNGDLENVEYEEDSRFHISIPKSCPKVDTNILNPKNTWQNKDEYETRANKLAKDFADFFDKNFKDLKDEIRMECPGK